MQLAYYNKDFNLLRRKKQILWHRCHKMKNKNKKKIVYIAMKEVFFRAN